MKESSQSGRASSRSPEGGRRGRMLLALGALSGMALALAGALVPRSTSTPVAHAGTVATVNGHAIRSETYAAVVGMLGDDKRNPVSDADRSAALDRLIDEELLVQRGLELGLVESDPMLRKAVVQAMIESILADAATAADPPSEAELQAYWRDHRDYFSRPAALRIRRIVFSRAAHGDDAQERADRAAASITAGRAFEQVAAELGDTPILAVPDALLRPSALREYIGGPALDTVLAMHPGEVSDPLPYAGGYQIVELTARDAGDERPWSEVRAEVEEAYRRTAEERALRSYLDRLREDADVVVADGAPR